ncbi:RNA methyltransferase [Alphaproteobacteria bacterium]|jgi:tRNA/rRNA methyltransferase|nr:RNA methyltransferase [Alphaproteobacteria bacterium]|tara:strand:- start:837 stop:1598 length:762 start_codon:yes stop_codon:yes gene_type:complete
MKILTPYIILSRPQLGENIGSSARAMKNFGIEKLRLISPRDGWPNKSSYAISAGADDVLDNLECFESLDKATHDISLLIATTARKRVIGTKSLNIIEAISKSFQHVINGGKVGFLFGPEQSGLSNDDVVQADYTISIPLNKNFSSLNLSQAVLLICWEWNKLKISELSPQDNEVLVNKKIKKSTELSNVGDREYFYKQLDEMLTKSGFFYSPEMAPVVKRNIRSLFNRASLTHQDLRTLHGIIRSLSEKGNRA